MTRTTTIDFGGEVKNLHFGTKVLKTIERTVSTYIYGEGGRGALIEWPAVMQNLSKRSVLSYLILLGCDWSSSEKIGGNNIESRLDVVDELIDKYVDAVEPDGGERLATLNDLVGSAFMAGYGLDPKKILAATEDPEKIQKQIDDLSARLKTLQEKKPETGGGKQSNEKPLKSTSQAKSSMK